MTLGENSGRAHRDSGCKIHEYCRFWPCPRRRRPARQWKGRRSTIFCAFPAKSADFGGTGAFAQSNCDLWLPAGDCEARQGGRVARRRHLRCLLAPRSGLSTTRASTTSKIARQPLRKVGQRVLGCRSRPKPRGGSAREAQARQRRRERVRRPLAGRRRLFLRSVGQGAVGGAPKASPRSTASTSISVTSGARTRRPNTPDCWRSGSLTAGNFQQPARSRSSSCATVTGSTARPTTATQTARRPARSTR